MFVFFLLVKKKQKFLLEKYRIKFSIKLDEQNCALKFASWTYDSARIDLTQKTNIGDLSNFMANSGRFYFIIYF